MEGRVDDEDDKVEGAALAAASKSEGDGERVVEGVAAAAVVAELDVRRGVLSMADNSGATVEVEDALDRLDDDFDGWWLTAGRRWADDDEEEEDVVGATADSCSWISIMWSPRRIVRFSGAFPDRKSFT